MPPNEAVPSSLRGPGANKSTRFLWPFRDCPARSFSYIAKVRGRTSAATWPPHGTMNPCPKPRSSPNFPASKLTGLNRRAPRRSPRSRTLGTLTPWAVRGAPWAKCFPLSETSPGTRTESAAAARRTHRGPLREALIRTYRAQEPRHSPGRALPTHLGTLTDYPPETHIKQHFRAYAEPRRYRPPSSFFRALLDI